MENFDINALDIKTLRLLISIYETGSVSRAADLRGMTQSTASYGLDKLRCSFGDPLFERSGRRMIPTYRGIEIITECQKLINRLDQLGQKSQFDPQTAKFDFVIAATSYEIETVIAPLFSKLHHEAPNIRLTVKNMDMNDQVGRLEKDWDMAFMASAENSTVLRQQKLFEDKYVTFYDASFREAPKTLEDFISAPHAMALLGGSQYSEVDRQLKKKGLERQKLLIVDQFQSLPTLMKGTNLISTLPQGLGNRTMKGFSFVDCPIKMPKLPIYCVWHVIRQQDNAHKWLRNLIKTFFI